MPSTTDTISVPCACGKKLKAPATAVGRRAKCPSCGTVLTIAAPPTEPEITEPEPQYADDDPLGAMYDLAATEKAAANSAQLDDSPRCPNLAASMQPGAILCTTCGFDTRSNKKVAVAAVPRVQPTDSSKKKKPIDKMAPDGLFAIGLAASLALGLAGGLLWFLITYATGINFYFVCALVGVGAGVGMRIGHKGYSNLGGLTAVGTALLALLIFRFAIVVSVLLPAADHLRTANGLYAPGMGVVVAKPLSDLTSGSAGAFGRTHSASDAMSDPLFWPVFFSVKGTLMIAATLWLAYRTAAGGVY